jgi:hypothetical protein
LHFEYTLKYVLVQRLTWQLTWQLTCPHHQSLQVLDFAPSQLLVASAPLPLLSVITFVMCEYVIFDGNTRSEIKRKQQHSATVSKQRPCQLERCCTCYAITAAYRERVLVLLIAVADVVIASTYSKLASICYTSELLAQHVHSLRCSSS